jgi:hypothetical protein
MTHHKGTKNTKKKNPYKEGRKVGKRKNLHAFFFRLSCLPYEIFAFYFSVFFVFFVPLW